MSQGKRKPRQTTCTLFFLKMFDMMNWNPDHRYKMLGNIIRANGEYLIAFDLTSTEVYQRTYDEEGGKSTASRTPVYPIGWQNQFGMTFNEHKQSMLVNIFDGYKACLFHSGFSYINSVNFSPPSRVMVSSSA